MATVKKRRPNCSERELIGLAESVIPRNRILKSKFSPSVTSERKAGLWREVADPSECILVMYFGGN
jgi:hypothetical protein